MSKHTPQPSLFPAEEWRDIPGYPNYQASSFGRVRSLPRMITQQSRFNTPFTRQFPGKILESAPERNGYRYTKIHSNGLKVKMAVHSLIALTFLGPQPDNHVAHHLNHKKLDNRPENLQYVHRIAHARYHGKEAKATQYRPKLTADDVKDIHRLAALGMRGVDIAARKGITQPYVSDILTGRARRWRHIR